ncbi:FAD-dependent oxidoreductase [Haladaptatus sp. YSMS36]|uniref:FAD-dependent oxidoreductase n=1 Tax=Haladaptatus sp. YSMS36 TaxID=3033384 RepID=UPI0023E8CD46|nr:FAD-dependent oxidoreductase [Haladaptatus sp. YSMS36]
MTEAPRHDVLVVGGGVAGLTAGIFTARANLDTLVVNHGESILNRNSHLENVPGFPAGINSRLFLDMTRAQAARNGCVFTDEQVLAVERDDAGFVVNTDEGILKTTYVIVASWPDSTYLDGLDVELDKRGSKQYVGVDEKGRTDEEGLYAAGRIAAKYHQTVVSAGHGAEVALTLIHDSDVPFYNDWVAPEGYFTERGREVPPGCEEISEDERERRERQSLELMQSYFEEPHPDEPTMHPSVVAKRRETDE